MENSSKLDVLNYRDQDQHIPIVLAARCAALGEAKWV